MTKRKNHSPDFKTKVTHEAIRKEITLAELPNKSDQGDVLQTNRTTS